MTRAWRVGAVVLALAAGGCGHIVFLHDPLSAPEHNDLGVAYEARGQLDLAAREYRRALHLDRGFTRARVNLGNVAAARGRWSEAAREYRRALRRDGGDADAMNNLAVALLRRGRDLEAAARWADRAVALGGPGDSLYRATVAEIAAARSGDRPDPRRGRSPSPTSRPGAATGR